MLVLDSRSTISHSVAGIATSIDDGVISSTPSPPSDLPAFDIANAEKIMDWREVLYEDLVAQVSATTGSAMSLQEREKEGFLAPRFVYGEVGFSALREAFRIISEECGGMPSGMPGGPSFLDIGSGTGKALIAAALLHEWKSCTGMEILVSLHSAALGVVSRWDAVRVGQNTAGKVEVLSEQQCATVIHCIHGDICEIEQSSANGAVPGNHAERLDIGAMDLVLMNGTCFDERLTQCVAKAADRMRPGAFFITTSNMLASVKWEVMGRFVSEGNWGSVTIYIHRRRDKKTALLYKLAHTAAGTSKRY